MVLDEYGTTFELWSFTNQLPQSAGVYGNMMRAFKKAGIIKRSVC